MRIGSLFSGIGGLELGLEWAGVGHTVFQVEQDPYCLAVLAKHWPDAQRFTDVREVGAHNLPAVDVLCGGFPCQDISVAGRGAGLSGARSGLWTEYVRLVRELRPRYVVVENVAALLARGFDDVLGGLAALGYDAEWSCVPACAVGAPHSRERLFVVAYASGAGRWEVARSAPRDEGAHEGRPQAYHHLAVREDSSAVRRRWSATPRISRATDGLPRRMDRVRALGNAVVPQVAEVVGRRLMQLAEVA